MAKHRNTQDHSAAWVIQTWLSFAISVGATSLGIIFYQLMCGLKVIWEWG